jgi:hypothetical protein
MEEDRIMDLMHEHGIITLTVDHLHKHYGWYKIETLEAASKFLSNAFNSEAYATESKRFIPNEAAMTKVVGLKGFFVSELVSVYGMKKKDVQKLLDELEKFERVVGPAVITPLKARGVEEKKEEGKTDGSSSATDATGAATATSATTSAAAGTGGAATPAAAKKA